MTRVVYLCFEIPSSPGVDFCWNSSLRGVDRSDTPLCDDRRIVSAEESRGRSSYFDACAGCQSYQSRPRPTFALYQNKNRGGNVVLSRRVASKKANQRRGDPSDMPAHENRVTPDLTKRPSK